MPWGGLMQLFSRQRWFAIVLVIAFAPVWAEAQTEAGTPVATP